MYKFAVSCENLFFAHANNKCANALLFVYCTAVQRRMISVHNFFVFLRFFCFVVAICDLVHAVEATYYVLRVNSIWKSFLKYE